MTYDRELRTEAAHALTHNQEVWSDRGYAVVTAGGLSEGDTDFEVDVGPYDVLVGDTDTVSVGPTTLSVNAPDSDPYWLVLYVDGEGLQTEQGPEGEVFVGDQSVVASNADVREITSPAPPTLADIGPVTVLGKVLVTSSGVSDSLIDDRVFQSERVFESIDARSASVESLVANNVVVDEGSDLSFHKGDLVDVDAGSTETIFDVTEPVDIVHGTVHGTFASFIRVEFGDGTTKDVYDGRRRARDDEDNIFETAPLPSCKDVVKLEFKNDGGRTLTYGWEVATI